ncbi:MAG: folate-binding protein, partial [Haemophilus parainfluenzae]
TIVSAVNFDGVLWLQVVMNNDLEEGIHFRLPEDRTILKIEPLPYSINS